MSSRSNRSKPRPARFPGGIHAELASGSDRWECLVRNLSRGGALLSGPFSSVAPAGPVTVTLRAPVGDLSVRLEARVARAEPDPEGGTLVAVEFAPADAEQREALEALLSRIFEARAPLPLEDVPPNATPEELRHFLESIPLPRRVSLAHRAKPRERELLIHDPHPQVLDSLARNANLIPDEVRELAAARHLMPHTLEILARDPRWQRDDELKIIVATHPQAPAALCDRLLGGLKLPALKRALQRPGLTDMIRKKLLQRISRATSRGQVSF